MTAEWTQLRPLSMGEILDQAIRLYRRNLLKFVGVLALPMIPAVGALTLASLANTLPLFLSLRQRQADLSPVYPLATLFSYLIQFSGTMIYSVLLQAVAYPALTRAVAAAYLGQPDTIFGTYRKIGKQWVQIFIALILGMVLSYLISFWTLVPCIGWVTGMGMGLFYGFAIMQLITPIIIFEKRTAFDIFRRAWDLARRRFWWLTGFGLLLIIFAQALMGGPSTLAFTVLVASIPGFVRSGDPTLFITLQTVFTTTINLLSTLVYIPLQITAMTLVYLDLRVRTEGLDLALLSESVLGRQTPADVVADAPALQKGQLITRKELGYFALLSVPLAALIAGLIALFFLSFFAALLGP